MKKILNALFLLLVSISYSQNIIRGKVINQDKEIIENASITIEDPSDSSVLAFSITDKNGDYRIDIESTNLKLNLVVNAINYEKIIQSINSKSQVLNFTLKNKITELEEVKIDIKEIQKRGDTLTYDVKSFEGKEDRTLSDVLKKIPGIEVDANGLIKYQGTAINKFYVEGKDLMAGGYGSLTNSMPKDAVTKLQVLENHQPIKALKNSVPSERAAINIKLKKDVTLTGRADTGVGLSPFLWSAKLTPMVFTKKYQYLLNYKSNNIGEDVTYELQTLSFDEGFEGLTFENQTGNWLNVSQSELPKIDENRYLFNKTQLFSANLLTDVSKNWELKANTNFYNNKINNNGNQYSKVNIFDAFGNLQNTIEYNRLNNSSTENNQFKSQIIFTKNSDKSFLKNTTTYKGNWNTIQGSTLINSSNTNQYVSSPGYSFQNSLSAIFLVGKKLVNFKSTFNYINDKQNYFVEPLNNINIPQFSDINAKNVNQNVIDKTISMTNEASYIFSIKKLSIIPSIGFEIEAKNLKTNFNGENSSNETISFGNNFSNNMVWKKHISSSSFSINYVGESLTFNTNLPLKYYSLNAKDNNLNFHRNLNKLTFEPNFSTKYKFTTELSNTLYGSINNNFGTLNSIYPSYIFSALNFTNQNSDIQQSISQKIGGNFEYKLILYNLFLNLNYQLSQDSSNNTISQNVMDNGQTNFQQISSKNKSINRNANIEISKYIPKIKSKVSLEYGISSSSNNIILNNNKLLINSTGNTFTFKANNNYYNWLTFDYNLFYSINQRGNINKTNTLKSNLKILLYPVSNQTFGIYRDDYIYQFNNQNFRNQFIDLSYQYTMEKRKIDFELKWTNILNTKTYEEVILNDLGYTSNIIVIRPSQIFASVKFNFN
ncbi:MAG TPA: hypothetical protein PK218_00550 [Flavobacterium sp.]|nr:hypothetical protein [Flavobacterium sp.]